MLYIQKLKILEALRVISCKFLCLYDLFVIWLCDPVCYRKRVQQSFVDKRRLGASLDNLDTVIQDTTVEGTNKSLGAPGTSVSNCSPNLIMYNECHMHVVPLIFILSSLSYGEVVWEAFAYETVSQPNLCQCLGQHMCHNWWPIFVTCTRHGFSFFLIIKPIGFYHLAIQVKGEL